jgi:hypothetical protein
VRQSAATLIGIYQTARCHIAEADNFKATEIRIALFSHEQIRLEAGPLKPCSLVTAVDIQVDICHFRTGNHCHSFAEAGGHILYHKATEL